MQRITLGLTDKVIVLGNNGKKEEVIARVDSGATSSSLDLALAKELHLGPILRTKLIKSASGNRKRPIVKAHVKIHGQTIETIFTLADRSHMTYRMLIGQNLLRDGKFLIDPLKRVEKK